MVQDNIIPRWRRISPTDRSISHTRAYLSAQKHGAHVTSDQAPMPASEILQRLQKRAQINHTAPRPSSRPSAETPAPRSVASGERVVDPVVARLKAARKRENEEKMKLKQKESKSPAAKKQPAGSRPTKPPAKSGAPAKSAARANKAPETKRPVAAAPKPKMTFNELMKKASCIDQSKMSINLKPKPKSPEVQARSKSEGVKKEVSSAKSEKRPQVDRRTKNEPPARGPATRAPIPIRKPSSGLQQRLKEREPEPADSESDMGSFIESEEETATPHDYDRDEIWSIFNKGRKRSYYTHMDDDSDDMEATGAEILEEENRSKRNALEEDRREMEEEARLAALKKKRRGH